MSVPRAALLAFMAILPVAGALMAEELAVEAAPLLRVPDLSPLLTSEEVSKEFATWAERVKKIIAGGKAETAASLAKAREALGPRLPQVTVITLYSLFPVDAPNIRPDDNARAEELKNLPRFHDFPILGEVKIDDPASANRWVDFLRDQIIPGGFFACDFMPRHGFRLSTGIGDIDFLMCYSCDQLAYLGSPKLKSKDNPVFPAATKAQINQLFDKLKIQRDIPPQGRE